MCWEQLEILKGSAKSRNNCKTVTNLTLVVTLTAKLLELTGATDTVVVVGAAVIVAVIELVTPADSLVNTTTLVLGAAAELEVPVATLLDDEVEGAIVAVNVAVVPADEVVNKTVVA